MDWTLVLTIISVLALFCIGAIVGYSIRIRHERNHYDRRCDR
jgi:hypothetical protein